MFTFDYIASHKIKHLMHLLSRTLFSALSMYHFLTKDRMVFITELDSVSSMLAHIWLQTRVDACQDEFPFELNQLKAILFHITLTECQCFLVCHFNADILVGWSSSNKDGSNKLFDRI